MTRISLKVSWEVKRGFPPCAALQKLFEGHFKRLCQFHSAPWSCSSLPSPHSPLLSAHHIFLASPLHLDTALKIPIPF